MRAQKIFKKPLNMGPFFWAKSLNMGTFFTSKHGLGSRGPGGTPPSKPKSSTPPGCDAPPNLPKGPLLATKCTKNGVFVGGLRGVRFKKSTFGGSHTPQIDPGYGPEREKKNFLLGGYISKSIFASSDPFCLITSHFIHFKGSQLDAFSP